MAVNTSNCYNSKIIKSGFLYLYTIHFIRIEHVAYEQKCSMTRLFTTLILTVDMKGLFDLFNEIKHF